MIRAAVPSVPGIDPLSESVPFPGATSLSDPFNPGPDGRPTFVAIPPEASWRDLFEACSKLMELTGDIHHVFVEGIHPDPASDGTHLLMATGS